MVSVLVVLAAVALPIYSGFIGRAKVAAMQSDLRNLATVQEAYFGDHQGYAPDASSLDPQLQTSENVTVVIDSGTATGWGATAMHAGTASSCRIAYSRTGQSAPTCNEAPVIRIVDPRVGAAINSQDVAFVLSASGVRVASARGGGEGGAHHHLFIDREVTPLSEPIPHGEADIIHLRPGQFELRLPGLDWGQHQVIAVLANEAHVPLVPPVTDTVRFSVRRP